MGPYEPPFSKSVSCDLLADLLYLWDRPCAESEPLSHSWHKHSAGSEPSAVRICLCSAVAHWSFTAARGMANGSKQAIRSNVVTFLLY